MRTEALDRSTTKLTFIVGLVLALAASLLVGTAGGAAASHDFPDVPDDHAFHNEISWAYAEGITDGFRDGTFRPTAPVARQAAVAFLYRMAGEPEVDDHTAAFSDVGPNHAFADAISWAYSEDVTEGFPDGTFRPTAPVTRQAAAAFLYRTIGEPLEHRGGFVDVADTHAFYDEISWMAASGITMGFEGGDYRPTSAVTRQAQITFLYRSAALDLYLRDIAPDRLRIGSAVAGGGHHLAEDYPEPFPNDEDYRAVLADEFDSLTPENQLKWDHLRPSQEDYNFDSADAIVAFAEENDQDVRGHALFWHGQNPEWLEEGDFTEEELRDILEDHVKTVVGRYAGQIQQWDVANEIFDDGGEDRGPELRMEENIWLRELGVDIIGDVFRWAHEADPDALLFVNDYNVEGMNDKANQYYELVQDLLDDDVPVHGFGAQAHLGLQYGIPGDIAENLQRFDDLGLYTAITEADVRMPLDNGPTPQQNARQAAWYGQLLEGCLAVEGCESFTVWGFPDRYSWVPNTFEGQGGATIYWDDLTPKSAYFQLRNVLLADG